MKPAIAIFDLDKTLLPFDCDEQWGLHLHRRGLCDADFLTRQAAYFEQYDQGTLDIHEYQAFSLAATIKAGPARAREELAHFTQHIVQPSIPPKVASLIESHRQRGHWLLVITATNHFVSRAVVDLFAIRDLLAIDLEVDETGWFNGKIRGIPSFRQGKVDRFREWLTERNIDMRNFYTYFYSDSMNDLPLLSFVDQPVATNPSADLRQFAKVNQWQIMDLF